MSENKDIALKAWDIYQNLIKAMGESAWKIRSVFLTSSSALIAYSYTSNSDNLYWVVSLMSILFLFLESIYRILQDQYIIKSTQIERTLNDFIAYEKDPVFPNTLGTSLNTPTFKKFRGLFKFKRVLFWLPYVILFFVPIVLYYVSKENMDQRVQINNISNFDTIVLYAPSDLTDVKLLNLKITGEMEGSGIINLNYSESKYLNTYKVMNGEFDFSFTGRWVQPFFHLKFSLDSTSIGRMDITYKFE